MTTVQPSDTFTARVGRWSFRHQWTVVAIWIVAAVAGALAAGPIFAHLSDSNGPSPLESIQAGRILDQGNQSAGTLVGVVRSIDPQSILVRTQVAQAATDLAQVAGVQSVTTPYTANDPTLLAKDGRGLLIQVKLGDLSDDATRTATGAIGDRLRALAPPLNASVLVGGDPLVNDQANAQAQTDLSKAEELSLPITLVILVFVFGGIIAAGIPVLAAVATMAGSLTVLWLFSLVTSLDQDAITVVTLLGLGLSIDYGLLLVARYRDELAAGFEPVDAIGRAWATAGRTIVFSALTVAAALCGLLVFGLAGLSAMGAAGVSVALVAMLASLSFTAALLRFAGRRVRPSTRHTRRSTDAGFFTRLARLVQRRPLVTAVGTGAVLLAAGLPLLTTTVHIADLGGLPRSLESVRVIDVLSDQFNQAPSPAVTVVARTDAATLDGWARQFAGTTGVTRVYPADQVGSQLSVLSIDASGDPEGSAALSLVDRVRADRPAGVPSWVTGDAAVHRDIIGLILARLPWAIGLTLLSMVLLLFAMTGSLVVPIKAALMNVVSLGATFGVLNAVFEHGFLAGLLHTTTVGGLSPFVIVTVFAFAFGLSMDYEVFLLARIKEQVDRGYPTDVAVQRGLQRSGRIITSAALLMVVVFSCFVTGRIGNVQQIGLGLAVAVAIDATIVRCVLVPAMMTLLGRRNWWAPEPLARLHKRLGLGVTFTEAAPAETVERKPVLVGR
jgi:RND superfamily putative drug exporter